MQRSQSPTSPQRLRGAEAREEVLRLRRLGLNYADIQAKTGLSKGRISQILTKAMADLAEKEREHTEAARELELQRLDARLTDVYGFITLAIEEKDADSFVKLDARLGAIAEHRARLMGLYAPQKADVTSGGEAIVIKWADGESDGSQP